MGSSLCPHVTGDGEGGTALICLCVEYGRFSTFRGSGTIRFSAVRRHFWNLLLQVKMIKKSRLVVVIVCSACFATIWRIYSSRLTFKAVEEVEEFFGNMYYEKPEIMNETCSCGECISENNVFLMLRYNKSVLPFLTHNGTLSQEDFTCWKMFQLESGSLKTFNAAKERLFTVFPSKPEVVEPSLKRCRTCAVVGNSGNLIGSNYGRQIDANDIVIRMNLGRTAGYEVDVGNKTTHRVMYPESSMDLDNDTHLVLFPFKILDLQWITEAFTTGFHGRSYAPVKTKITANKNLVMVVNPGFMNYVHKSWILSKGQYPSTGFMTLVLAIHICDEVNVFGFGADKNGNWNHYWEVLHNIDLQTGVHPGTYEYNLIQELGRQNIINFKRGW